MKHLPPINNLLLYAPRKNEPTDGPVLDKICDEMQDRSFHYVAIVSDTDARVNGYTYVLEHVHIDFEKYNLIIVIPDETDAT